jgi:hypothetical protein
MPLDGIVPNPIERADQPDDEAPDTGEPVDDEPEAEPDGS